jgi:endoglucanase
MLPLATLASLIVSCAPSVPTSEPQPLNSVPKSRLDKLATGANVCRWFRYPEPDDENHAKNYLSDSEIKMIRSTGLKHVRLAIAPKYILDSATGAIREDFATHIDNAIRRFHKAGLMVVVDIHNEDRPTEADPAWQDRFVKFWGEYAARLRKFDPEMTVLEFMNEPVLQGKESTWYPLSERIAAAIRKSAPNHTIITSGAWWGGVWGLLQYKPLPDKNVVYSFHTYDPFPFSHQAATWAGPDVLVLKNVPYPSSPELVAPLLPALKDHPNAYKMLENYGKENWGKRKMTSNFKQAVDWGKKYNVPLYCGEFGVYPVASKPEHRANWFRDFGQVLAENNIGWSVWGWDEGFGLNRRYEGGQPKLDNVVAEALGLKVTK